MSEPAYPYASRDGHNLVVLHWCDVRGIVWRQLIRTLPGEADGIARSINQAIASAKGATDGGQSDV